MTNEEMQTTLNITDETTFNDLLNQLEEMKFITKKEIRNVNSISVKPLPTNVVNQEKNLKERFVGIVTNENNGMSAILNKRIYLINEIIKAINLNVENTSERINNIDNSIIDINKEIEKINSISTTALWNEVSKKLNKKSTIESGNYSEINLTSSGIDISKKQTENLNHYSTLNVSDNSINAKVDNTDDYTNSYATLDVNYDSISIETQESEKEGNRREYSNINIDNYGMTFENQRQDSGDYETCNLTLGREEAILEQTITYEGGINYSSKIKNTADYGINSERVIYNNEGVNDYDIYNANGIPTENVIKSTMIQQKIGGEKNGSFGILQVSYKTDNTTKVGALYINSDGVSAIGNKILFNGKQLATQEELQELKDTIAELQNQISELNRLKESLQR